jgi:ABC-type uncharacterized transport system permease subunit
MTVTKQQEEYWGIQIRLAEDQIRALEKQGEHIQKQQEFLDFQKKDLLEEKKNRKAIEQFTFVLAFGVIASIFFSLFQIVVEFQKSSNLQLSIISAIFVFLFIFYIEFASHVFPMKKEMRSFWKKDKLTIVGTLIVILVLGWILLTTLV